MRRVRFWCAAAVLGSVCLLAPGASSQPTKKPSPKLEAVAETKLLMEGLTSPNARGLGRVLKDRPKDAEAWGFARGQALLIAESGNLLMLRPPKTKDAQDTWMMRSADLRDAASGLAKAAAAQDYVRARAGLAAVANACNRCHLSFKVPTRVNPFLDAD